MDLQSRLYPNTHSIEFTLRTEPTDVILSMDAVEAMLMIDAIEAMLMKDAIDANEIKLNKLITLSALHVLSGLYVLEHLIDLRGEVTVLLSSVSEITFGCLLLAGT